MTWVCGDCGTKSHAAVPTCIFCLTTERDRLRSVLEMFAIDASLLLDTLPAELPHLFQKMSAQAVADRIEEAHELCG